MTARADEAQLLAEGVYHWSYFDSQVKCEVGCAALVAGTGLVVIDPLPLAPEAWQELLAVAPLRAILITNGNHVREAEALRTAHQVPIAIAPATRKDIAPVKADIVLMPGELIYGIATIPIPGATAGETAFFHAGRSVMVLGDAVIHGAAGLEFLPDKYSEDPRQSRESLHALLAYDYSILLLAHGAPVVRDAREKLRSLLES